MADMANLDQTEDCWSQLTELCPDDTIIPITYMNSSAAIKAFVGEHHGAVCTSSNCRNVLEWALKGGANKGSGFRVQGSEKAGLGTQHSAPSSLNPEPRTLNPKILFFPDQHLGRNTAYAMGYPLDRMITWDPREDLGGNTEEQVKNATFILWKGHCSVHALFRPSTSIRSAPNTPT